MPVESAIHVYDEIVRVGEPMGLVHAGLKALGSLRMEKGYRDYGHDLDNLDTLMEAGLGFTADFEKRDRFVGMERTLEQKASGPPARRLVQVLLHDPQPLMHHGEIVYRDGEIVGEVRSASYGHSLSARSDCRWLNAPTAKGLLRRGYERALGKLMWRVCATLQRRASGRSTIPGTRGSSSDVAERTPTDPLVWTSYSSLW